MTITQGYELDNDGSTPGIRSIWISSVFATAPTSSGVIIDGFLGDTAGEWFELECGPDANWSLNYTQGAGGPLADTTLSYTLSTTTDNHRRLLSELVDSSRFQVIAEGMNGSYIFLSANGFELTRASLTTTNGDLTFRAIDSVLPRMVQNFVRLISTVPSITIDGITISPVAFNFGPRASFGHVFTFIYPSVTLIVAEDIALPDWAEFASLNSTGNQNETTSVLTFNILTNIEPTSRNGEIQITNDMGVQIAVPLQQAAAEQVTGAEFVTDGGILTTLATTRTDVAVGAGGNNVDLVVFGEADAQFRLGPILNRDPANNGPGGVRVAGATYASYDGTPPNDIAQEFTSAGYINLQLEDTLDRNDQTPIVGAAAAGRNLYAADADGTNAIFIGEILAGTSSNGNPSRLRISRGSNTATDRMLFDDLVNPGALVWLADPGDVGTTAVKSFATTGGLDITLDNGDDVNDRTIYTVGSGGSTRIGLLVGAGDDVVNLYFEINPINAFSNQINIVPVNRIDREAVLRGSIRTLVDNPVPGNNFQLEITSSGHVAGQAVDFSLYSDSARMQQIGTTQTLTQTDVFNPFVAIESNMNGATRDTTFYALIQQSGNEFPDANEPDQTLQVTVTSAQMTFALTPTAPTFWNELGHSVTAMSSGASATEGDLPQNWRINRFAFSPNNGFTTGTIFGSPTLIGDTGFSANITAPSINHSPLNIITYSYVLNYVYENDISGPSTSTQVQLATASASHPLRPRVDFALIPSASGSLFNSDYNAMVTLKVISDSGNSLASTSISTQGEYPTVDTGSTQLWIEDSEQVPTNAQLIADTTNQLYDLFNEVTSLSEIQELEAIVGFGGFDSNGTRSLLPYVGSYTITLSTHDETDTLDDQGAAIGANIGRNTTGATRDSNVMLICNDRSIS